MTRTMELRRLSRQYFPYWSVKMRAKWVMAKLHAGQPKVGMNKEILDDPRHYRFGSL